MRIARDHGVEIPEDVEFFVDEENYCDETTFAIGMRVSPRPPDEPVQWSELVHDLTGKVPFLIRPDVLNSDEAIVAVLAHEPCYALPTSRNLLVDLALRGRLR